MNVKKNRKRSIVISTVIAALLIFSVLTAGVTGVHAQDTETALSEEETESDPALLEEVLENIEERDPTDPVDRPDVLDPELTEILSGSEVSREGLSSSEDLLTDPHTIDQHQVEPVHDMGITGENVTVSLMDTGFDMAHPDLIGTHAVFEYDEDTMPDEYEAYDGHPIAFDPVSMADYAFDGEISQDYEVMPDFEDNSWYVDTSYETETYEYEGYIWADYGDETYNVTEVAEAEEEVRFGDHPDEKLHIWYEERPAVLLTQNDDGDWTNVYVDLENDKEFVEETGAWIDGEDPESEMITKDVTGDDIADISGGMVYFVSDGERAIPYMDHFRDTMNKIINLYMGYPPGTIGEMDPDVEDAWEAVVGEDFYTTPEDGDMVALMGDFNEFGSMGAHGTWTASAVAGQAVTGVPEEDILVPGESPYPPGEPGEGLPRGMAPNATIIPMGRFFDYLPPENPLSIDQYAVPTTYSSLFFTAEGYTGDVEITCDSADIASSSFGRTIDENHGGFNFYERLFDYVGTQYTENTLFINSQGNSGSGFGTVSAPSGAQGVLSVGATGNQMYRVDPWRMDDGGPNPWYGDVTGMTSTGPHSKGSHGPDIMTNGQFGYGGDPLNQQLENIGDFQGNNSWTLWSGTSLSAPNAAGIAALVYEAYEDAHGEAPTAETLKNIVMQGADDINNTPNLQGPGDANAYDSVQIAQGGLYSEEFQWRPGTNPEMGEHVEHHVNMMEPGEEVTDEMTLHNWHDEDIDYEMTPYRMEQEDNASVELNSGTGPIEPQVMINETGVYELEYDEDNENWNISDLLVELDDPEEADLLRFGTHTPLEEQDQWDYAIAQIYNWEDVNDNSSYDGWEERNRIGYTFATLAAVGEELTSDYFTIHDALERAEDGIILQIDNLLATEENPIPESFNFTLNIEMYNQVEWDWIEIDEPEGSIPVEDSLEYNITAEVPEEAPKGIYSGKMMLEDTTNDRTMQIPITITVGEHTDLAEPMHFGAGDGDAEEDFGIYRNDRLYGSWEGGLNGDWRFYTFHLTEDIVDSDVKLELEWDDPMSDMTAFLLGGAEHDLLELGEPYEEDPFSIVTNDWDMIDRYGVNTLETIDYTDLGSEGYVALERDMLESGTYMIALQSHQISGHEPYQEFSAELSTSIVSTEPSTIISEEKASLNGELLSMPENVTEVDVFFRFRFPGDEWNETEEQVMEDVGEFEETLEGLETGATYEFKAVTQWEDHEETGVVLTFEPQEVPVEMILDPEEGDVVQGDSLVISGEIAEEHPVENLYSAHLSLDGWWEDGYIDIGEPEVEFELPVVLAEQSHTYHMEVEDEEGNTNEFEVTFEVDNTVPMLNIDLQNDVETDEAIIYGETEEGVTVWINDEPVELDEEFGFEETVTLEEGDNYIEIVAEDEAGNEVVKELTASYIPEIDDLRGDIEDLYTQIDDLWNELDALEDDLQGQIDDLWDELDALEDDLQGQVDDLWDELDALEDDLQGQVDDLWDELDALEGDIEDIKDDIAGLEDDIAGLEDDIAGLEDDIAGLEDDIAGLEDDIADIENDIAGLEDDIADIEDDISDLEDDVDMARNLGIVGMILAILAVIIAIFTVVMKKQDKSEPEEEEMFEEKDETVTFEE